MKLLKSWPMTPTEQLRLALSVECQDKTTTIRCYGMAISGSHEIDLLTPLPTPCQGGPSGEMRRAPAVLTVGAMPLLRKAVQPCICVHLLMLLKVRYIRYIGYMENREQALALRQGS